MKAREGFNSTLRKANSLGNAKIRLARSIENLEQCDINVSIAK